MCTQSTPALTFPHGGLRAMLQIPPTPTTILFKNCNSKNMIKCTSWKPIASQTRSALLLLGEHSVGPSFSLSFLSISLRSELRANSDEELSCELELHFPQVYRYRLARFAGCLLMINVWRFFPAFPPCSLYTVFPMCLAHILARMTLTSSAWAW